MRIIVNIWFIFFCTQQIIGQDTLLVYDSLARFYYPGGQLSSEGMMRNGKPDGYWKVYYENGNLKSEGNRKEYELDSVWKFYNTEGKQILEIEYRNGKKSGWKTTWLDKEVIREQFSNDIKQGFTWYFHPDGYIKKEIPFVNGMMEGTGKEYSASGDIITITEYRKGFVVNRMHINRRDKNGWKQGRWVTFWEKGTILQDGSFKNDKQHGYVKKYTEKGDLISIEKYSEGVLQKEAKEIQKLEVDKTYYPDGKIQSVTLYRNGIKEGISSTYLPDGTPGKAIEYIQGHPAGEGMVNEDGTKTGYWKEFYPGGALRAEGAYTNDIRTGKWLFFHENGKQEQAGVFDRNGMPEGNWRWYFESGQLNREENYYRGKRDGMLEQYDETGLLVEKGEYINGLEDGYWIRRTGNCCEQGQYRDGMRFGLWQTFSLVDTLNGTTDSVLIYQGSYIDDLPDGEHIIWWEKDKIREKGVYIMGRKEGNWITYNYDGTLFLVTTFVNGTETRYDGIRIKPPLEQEE